MARMNEVEVKVGIKEDASKQASIGMKVPRADGWVMDNGQWTMNDDSMDSAVDCAVYPSPSCLDQVRPTLTHLRPASFKYSLTQSERTLFMSQDRRENTFKPRDVW